MAGSNLLFKVASEKQGALWWLWFLGGERGWIRLSGFDHLCAQGAESASGLRFQPWGGFCVGAGGGLVFLSCSHHRVAGGGTGFDGGGVGDAAIREKLEDTARKRDGTFAFRKTCRTTPTGNRRRGPPRPTTGSPRPDARPTPACHGTRSLRPTPLPSESPKVRAWRRRRWWRWRGRRGR